MDKSKLELTLSPDLLLGRACLRLGTGLVRPLSWWVRLIGLDSLECGSPEMWESL